MLLTNLLTNGLSKQFDTQQVATKNDSNIRTFDSGPDVEFPAKQNEEYLDPESVWDRGKLSHVICETPDDLKYLCRLENTVTHLESFLKLNSNQETLITPRNLENLHPSLDSDDTLSDLDWDRFDFNRENELELCKTSEVTPLSDYRNNYDVIFNIKERLQKYLKISKEVSFGKRKLNEDNLEKNIANLQTELDRYVHIINERKENELRNFFQNISNQHNVVKMKKAFSRKEKLRTHIYETLASSNVQYSLADNESLPDSLQERIRKKDDFTMKNCYDNDYVFETYADFSPAEYYTIIINEDNGEKLLNDAPQPTPRYVEPGTSFLFRDPEDIIRQWQSHQLETLLKEKSFKFKYEKRQTLKGQDWGFTLDYHQNRVLEYKLEKEKRIRSVFKMSFYFLSLVFFVLIVFLSQSQFSSRKREKI